MTYLIELLWGWKGQKDEAAQSLAYMSPYLKLMTTVFFQKGPVASPLTHAISSGTAQHINIAFPQWRPLSSPAAWDLRIVLVILLFYEFCQSKPTFSEHFHI